MANISAAIIIAKHLTELLNTKINTMDVFNEMFLIEHGRESKNKILNQFVKKIMVDHMTKK
jgi:hypothetical protein